MEQGEARVALYRQCEHTNEDNMEMRLWDGAAVTSPALGASFFPFTQSGLSVMCRIVLGREMKTERDHRLALSLKNVRRLRRIC